MAEGYRKLLPQSFHEQLHPLQNSGNYILKFLSEKFHELLLLLESFYRFLVEKFNEILPPETRAETLKHWLFIGLPVVLAVILFFLCLRYCCGCCKSSARSVKMMKAPGADGLMIPRYPFEANPKGYFRSLRGKPTVDPFFHDLLRSS